MQKTKKHLKNLKQKFLININKKPKESNCIVIDGMSASGKTTLVAEIAKIMMRADPYYDEEFHREIVIASCILHDICKYKSEDTSHTQFEHATLAADLVSETGKENKDYALISFLIAKNVATHMGRWNTSKYSSVELPKPHDEEQKLIHLADLISANKDLPNIINLFTKAAEEEMKDGK